MRWEATRQTIRSLRDTSQRLAAEFPGSDETARLETFGRVIMVLDLLEEAFPAEVPA